jgi:hypothetical protein
MVVTLLRVVASEGVADPAAPLFLHLQHHQYHRHRQLPFSECREA